MKLLIITQTVDRADPVLGFFHRWIEEFVKHCEKVTVIAHSVGDHHLSADVDVVSLGREKGRSRLARIFHFSFFIFHLRHQYDAVLVHMTPIWVVLGAPLWMFLGKPVYLWYEARGARWPLRAALLFVRKVFSASSLGMPIVTPKSVITGHGIDVGRFCPDPNKYAKKLFVSVGRISRAKRIEILLQALKRLPEDYVLMLIGEPRTKEDELYRSHIEGLLREKYLEPRVVIRSFPQDQIIGFLQSSAAFLHASETALDKAVLEAMACGCPVVSTNPAAKAVLPLMCHAEDASMWERVEYILQLSEDEQRALREDLRRRVVAGHSLAGLVERLVSEMQ